TSPSFVSGLVDLVLERAAQVRGEQPESSTIAGSKALGPGSGACSLNCCEGTTRKNTVPNWSAGMPAS
ncbi:MAG: ferrochelatase, partial [Glutamicibacter sp.]